MYRIVVALTCLAAPLSALAQGATGGDVYTLGELQVTARARSGEALGGAVVTGDQMQAYDKQTVDQALSLVPGANASNTGGSRNERVVYIRGFDRFQTTISIDGVRVFLPADNRIDFARFLTADLSEIQVSKGYVSVLDGPGGVGGAINLVTVKPTAPLEAEVQATGYLNRRLDGEAHLLSGRIGGRAGAFYWQASGAYANRDHFTLPGRFEPTALEDGGKREHSNSRDWRANLKAGWQPNDTDEYSINYVRSKGEKNAPYSVGDAGNARFWSWPYWNTDSIAFLSRTRLTDQLTLRARLYRNSFDNLLSAWDTAAQTTQSLPRAFNSYYKDHATGGNVELDYALGERNLLKGAFYVRRDVHHERQDGVVRTSAGPGLAYHEPWQTNDEFTYSVAGEYTAGLADDVDLVVGASYDWTHLKTANDVNVAVTAGGSVAFQPVNYPLRNNHALNGQAALDWRIGEGSRAHLSVSDRARFPTVFERFSSRMGAAIPNPDVKAERAINYEIGGETLAAPGVKLSGAAFYSDVKDALIQIPVVVPGFGAVNQTKNAGKGRYYGAEVGVDARLAATLDAGGAVTWIHRKLTDPTNPAFRPQGVPDVKVFAYANWRPLPKLSLRPSVEYAGQRWTVTTAAPLVHYRTGSYTLVNLTADYDIAPDVVVTLAVENLGDQLYQLTDGFPEAGRSFYASIRASF
jgi:iron complex outermembrane receptor protein